MSDTNLFPSTGSLKFSSPVARCPSSLRHRKIRNANKDFLDGKSWRTPTVSSVESKYSTDASFRRESHLFSVYIIYLSLRVVRVRRGFGTKIFLCFFIFLSFDFFIARLSDDITPSFDRESSMGCARPSLTHIETNERKIKLLRINPTERETEKIYL